MNVWMDKDGYLRCNANGRSTLLHYWVWEQAYGPVPKDHGVYHLDDDKTNNKLENLYSIPKINILFRRMASRSTPREKLYAALKGSYLKRA